MRTQNPHPVLAIRRWIPVVLFGLLACSANNSRENTNRNEGAALPTTPDEAAQWCQQNPGSLMCSCETDTTNASCQAWQDWCSTHSYTTDCQIYPHPDNGAGGGNQSSSSGQGGAQSSSSSGQGGNDQSSSSGQGGMDNGQGGMDSGQGGMDTGQGGMDTGQGGADTGQGGADSGQGGDNSSSSSDASSSGDPGNPGDPGCDTCARPMHGLHRPGRLRAHRR